MPEESCPRLIERLHSHSRSLAELAEADQPDKNMLAALSLSLGAIADTLEFAAVKKEI